MLSKRTTRVRHSDPENTAAAGKGRRRTQRIIGNDKEITRDDERDHIRSGIINAFNFHPLSPLCWRTTACLSVSLFMLCVHGLQTSKRMTAQVITINDSSRDHNQSIIMIALLSLRLILCVRERRTEQ